MDPTTNHLLSFAGIRCRVLGTFFVDDLSTGGKPLYVLRFGSDLSNYYPNRGLKVFKPRGDALRRMGRAEDHEPDGRGPVLLRLAELLADRPTRHRPILGLDDDPEVRATGPRRVERDHEVALLRAELLADRPTRPVDQVTKTTGGIAEQRLQEVLEVAALRRGPRPLDRAGRCRGLDGREPFVDAFEAAGHLVPELVHRGVLAGRVEEQGQLRRVSVEVGAEQRLQPADGAVPLRLVEQLADERPELAAIAEELLEGPRQPSVAVGEVRAEDLVERVRGPRVRLLRGAQELLELVAHHVDVHRRRDVLDREQTHLEGTLDHRRAVGRLTLGEDGREGGVAQDEPLDDDPVGVDVDLVRRELDDAGFHGRDGGPAA